jgi:glucosamine--fructose-6-phosphate aminotransferase (isomerizing)
MAARNQFEREILEQPEVLRRLLVKARPLVEEAAARIRSFSPDWVLIAARGSSDNAARYAQYLLGAHNGLGVALAVPSLFTRYEAPPKLGRALAIGVSQSGQSPDIVSVLAEARRQNAATIAVTNDPNSPLSTAAEHTISLFAGTEYAVAATKTYTAELLALAMLSVALEGNLERWRTLERVPEWVSEVLAKNADLNAHAEAFQSARKWVVLGRGFNYSTACELALKIKETSYSVAEAYSFADLLHGPVAMIDRGFPIIVVAPSGKTMADVPALLDLLEARGAAVMAISDDAGVLSRVVTRIELPLGVPEWVSPIVSAVPGQLWAGALALARGQNPDQPRGLSKVTITR